MGATVDKRMLWLRGLDAVSQWPSGAFVLEAEIASEARIFGELSYGDGAVCLRPTTFEPDRRGLFKYVLRVQSADEPSADDRQVRATKEGYAFPDGPIGELVALCSLRLQARLFLLSVTYRGPLGGDVPTFKTEFAPCPDRVDPRIDSVLFDESRRNFVSDVGPFLDEVRSLPAEFHLEFAVAAERYARALRTIGEDPELVIVYLVSAVERLAGRALPDDPLQGLSVEEIVRPGLLAPEQLEEFGKLLRTRRARQRFVEFIAQNSTDFLDNEKREPAHTQVTPANLRAVMAAVYDARSGYLHNGDPMYLSPRAPAFPDWHMDPSVGRYIQNRHLSERQKLPRIDFLHRLVRHCALNRMAELSPRAG
jgi:hypothetical protein